MSLKIALVSAFPPGSQSLNEYGLHLARETAFRPIGMKVLAILFLALAACGAPSKMLPQGPIMHQSALVAEKNSHAVVEARAMVMSGKGRTDYVLHLSVDDAAAMHDITFAYAFDTPMPYIADTPHSGYITMSLGVFRKLSQTGFDVVLVGGTTVYTINVPRSAFLEVLDSLARA